MHIRLNVALFFLLGSAGPAAAQAPTTPTVEETILASRKPALLRELDLEAATDEGPADVDGETFVSSRTALRGWTMSLTSQGVSNKFSFPIRVRGNLRQLAGNPIGPSRAVAFLDRSEVSLAYSPFSVTETQVSRPAGTDVELDVDRSRSLTFGYKYQLLRPSIDDYDADVRQAIKDADAKARKDLGANSPNLSAEQLALVGQAMLNAADAQLKLAKAKVAKRTAASLSGAYGLNWEKGSRDEAALKVTIGRGGFGTERVPIALATEGGWTVVRQEGAAGQTHIRRAAGSVEFTLSPNIKFTSEVGASRYSGAGFSGIRGVLDTTKRSEVNLAQQIGLSVAGNFVTFAVKTLHLGTGDPDFSLSTEFGFRLGAIDAPRRSAK